MLKLVYLGDVDGVDSFLERAAWLSVDGVEVDLTALTEEEFLLVRERLQDSPVKTKSLHYGRTETVALREWDLFKSQLEMLLDRADELDCDILSVHPPRVEKESAQTMRDLQEFVENVDTYAERADVKLCFELTGFMKDPQLINLAFAELTDPTLGVMIDLDSLVSGIDPVDILQKLSVDIHKVRFPMSLPEMNEHIDRIDSGLAAVATSLE